MSIDKSCSFIVILLLMMQSAITAQETLREQLDGRDNLYEIAAITEAWFADHPVDEKEFESAYTHWKRWEWYMSSRVDRNGNLVDYRDYLVKGLAVREKMQAAHVDRNINSNWSLVGPSALITSPARLNWCWPRPCRRRSWCCTKDMKKKGCTRLRLHWRMWKRDFITYCFFMKENWCISRRWSCNPLPLQITNSRNHQITRSPNTSIS